jgi:hypothetical protein
MLHCNNDCIGLSMIEAAEKADKIKPAKGLIGRRLPAVLQLT